MIYNKIDVDYLRASRYAVNTYNYDKPDDDTVRVRVEGSTRCGLNYNIIYTKTNMIYVSVDKKKSTAYMHKKPNYARFVSYKGDDTLRFLQVHTENYLKWASVER